MSMNNLPAQADNAPVQVGFLDSNSYKLAKAIALDVAASDIIPEKYRNKPSNCLIALNMAARIGADPIMVMQNLYIVHGVPSWSAQFLIATFNKCGKFSSIRYEFSGTEGQDNWGCRATAAELSTGEVLKGAIVTIQTAKDEGWYAKNGSKWKTMPQQMLQYRAAAWFVRTIAPEIAMGLQTADEAADVYEVEPNREGTYSLPQRGQSSSDLNAMLHAETPAAEPVIIPELERVKTAQELQDERDFAERLAAKKGPHDFLAPEEPQTRKRHTAAELEGLRADMVAEITEKGLDLGEIEKAVGEYSNKWNAAQIERVRGKIVPNLMAELMGA